MIPTELQQLLAWTEWADAMAWTAVTAEPAAAGDPRIRTLLHHVHQVQWAYLVVWRGEPLELGEPEDFPETGDLLEWGREVHAELARFVAGLAPDDLDGPVEFPWAGQVAERYGRTHPADLRQSLLQLPTHSAYHRGQVATRIREVGGEPPLTDFVVWVWAGRPGASWPERG